MQLFGISTEEVPFLPPALPEGYGRKYTLVIDMDALALCTQSNVCRKKEKKDKKRKEKKKKKESERKKINKSQKSSSGPETRRKVKLPFPGRERNTYERKTKQYKSPNLEQGDKNFLPQEERLILKNKKNKKPNNQTI